MSRTSAPAVGGSRTWVPRGRLGRRSRALVFGGVWLHCVTRCRARDLSRRLAAGADPGESDELSLRVGRLGSLATRARLAGTLRRAVEVANGVRQPLLWTMLRRAEIRRNEHLLGALADRVRQGGVLGVRGLAMVSVLVDDRRSPLYAKNAGRSLGAVAYEALEELDRGLRTASAVP